ncbi:MAG: hypothetical protein Q7S02_03740 [bacterium]|nr:hypothetical protein [bacterium]
MQRQRDGLLIVPSADGEEGQRQGRIMTEFCRHELQHQGDDARRTAKVVNQALARIAAAGREAVFAIPLGTLNALQDLGLPIAQALDVIEWCWDGLQEAKPRFNTPPSDVEVRSIHQVFVAQVVEALTVTYGRLLLRPMSRLRVGVRCAWTYGDSSRRSFRSVLEVAAQLFEVGCAEGQLPVFFRAFTNDALLLLKGGIATGRLTREEVLALAQSKAILQAFNLDEVNILFSAFAETRGRVRPNVLLKTVGAAGLHDAIALHAHTRSAEVACRADAMRKAYLISLNEYLLNYGALHERFGIDFEDYVALTEYWAPDILRGVYAAFPDTELILSYAHVGHAETLAQIARAGVSIETLRRLGRPILDYVRAKAGVTASVVATVFEQCSGDAALADVFLAIPESLREHSAVRQLLSDGQAAALENSSLLGLAVAIGDAGLSVDGDLLCAMQRIGSWPQRQNFVRVYGLAAQFMRTGLDADEAVREALRSFEALSPRASRRAIRNLGYFRYHVLGVRSSPRAPCANPDQTVDSGADAVRPTHTPWRPERTISRAEAGSRGSVTADAIDLRTVHERLDLRDLVADRVDPVTAAALIVYGLCDLGKGRPFAGGHAIPQRHVFTNIRRRFNPDGDALERAWTWLRRIGVIANPRARGGSDVYALDLRSDHADPTAQDVARRTSTFFTWFRTQTR